MLENESYYRRFVIDKKADALLVKMFDATSIIAKMLKKIRRQLMDAKSSFLAWIDGMKEMPGFSFNLPEVFRMALDNMPEHAFEINVPPLSTKLRTWKEVPGRIREQLAVAKPDYMTIMREAYRRNLKTSPEDSLKALSSLVEDQPGDVVLARDIGYSAMELGLLPHAVHLFRRVADLRPFEPQTYHALGLCLSEMGHTDLAMAFYEVALAGRWDARFQDFQSIAGMEYLRFLRMIEQGKYVTSVPAYAGSRLKKISKQYDRDEGGLIVMITWNTDATDVDLHVTEPTGEECNYSHPRTRIGGKLTRDVTQGYGPEMYVLPKTKSGKYRIRVKYCAQDRTRAGARTRVYATIYKKWGTTDEEVIRKAVTLETGGHMQNIAEVKVKSWLF